MKRWIAMRRVLLAAGLAALFAGVAGCSDYRPGAGDRESPVPPAELRERVMRTQSQR